MSIVVTDTYTDTAGTSATAHTPEAGGPIVVHPSFATSVAVISSADRLRNNFTANTVMYYSGTPASADYDVSADFFMTTSAAAATGIFGRLNTSTLTCYLLDYESGIWKIYSIVNGTNVLINTFSQTLTTNTSYHAVLSMRGSTITASINGSVIITMTDSNVTAAGKAGIFFNGSMTDTTGIHLDNLSAGIADTTGFTLLAYGIGV
jgi:hypothetical protein